MSITDNPSLNHRNFDVLPAAKQPALDDLLTQAESNPTLAQVSLSSEITQPDLVPDGLGHKSPVEPSKPLRVNGHRKWLAAGLASAVGVGATVGILEASRGSSRASNRVSAPAATLAPANLLPNVASSPDSVLTVSPPSTESLTAQDLINQQNARVESDKNIGTVRLGYIEPGETTLTLQRANFSGDAIDGRFVIPAHPRVNFENPVSAVASALDIMSAYVSAPEGPDKQQVLDAFSSDPEVQSKLATMGQDPRLEPRDVGQLVIWDDPNKPENKPVFNVTSDGMGITTITLEQGLMSVLIYEDPQSIANNRSRDQWQDPHAHEITPPSLVVPGNLMLQYTNGILTDFNIHFSANPDFNGNGITTS